MYFVIEQNYYLAATINFDRTIIMFFMKYVDIIIQFNFCIFINYNEILNLLYYIFIDLFSRYRVL